ncbi:MAG: MFS transporter [Gammaproteobacteria bacterium]
MNIASSRAMTRVIFSRRMLVALLMGFSSGLPLLLPLTLLQAWLTERGVSIKVIGLFALVGLPYIFKFVWAPLFDRYRVHFLGRRRGWLLTLQILLALSIAAIGLVGVPDAHLLITGNPARIIGAHPFAPPLALLPGLVANHIDALGSLLPGLLAVAAAALLMAFFSASQDTVIDAYRRESLADGDEQSLGASLYVWGYRAATLFAGGIGLILAAHMPFREVFFIMAAAMGVGIITTTFIAREPQETGAAPQTLTHAVIDPLLEFFRLHQRALVILAFILLYKLGDALATSLITTFYLKVGFSTETIGAIAKLFGAWALMGGVLTGGILILRLGIYRALLLFGILQGVSTLSFAWLVHTGPAAGWLAAVVSLQNFTDGMGTAALLGYMATVTDRRYSATQFALLSSLASVPRVVLSSFTGFMAVALGWPLFFIMCAVAAIPGLALIPFLEKPKAPVSGTEQA